MNVRSTQYLQAPADAADTHLLRRVFGTFGTGVTVVTVGGDNPHGMTANSFTTVSLRPPLVLLCVDRHAVMHARMAHGLFGVSVLTAGQEAIARYFANVRRPLGAAQFARIDHELGRLTGAPLLAGALAHFECEVDQAIEAGDHTVYLSRLLSIGFRPEASAAEALLFVRGHFHRLA